MSIPFVAIDYIWAAREYPVTSALVDVMYANCIKQGKAPNGQNWKRLDPHLAYCRITGIRLPARSRVISPRNSEVIVEMPVRIVNETLGEGVSNGEAPVDNSETEEVELESMSDPLQEDVSYENDQQTSDVEGESIEEEPLEVLASESMIVAESEGTEYRPEQLECGVVGERISESESCNDMEERGRSEHIRVHRTGVRINKSPTNSRRYYACSMMYPVPPIIQYLLYSRPPKIKYEYTRKHVGGHVYCDCDLRITSLDPVIAPFFVRRYVPMGKQTLVAMRIVAFGELAQQYRLGATGIERNMLPDKAVRAYTMLAISDRQSLVYNTCAFVRMIIKHWILPFGSYDLVSPERYRYTRNIADDPIDWAWTSILDPLAKSEEKAIAAKAILSSISTREGLRHAVVSFMEEFYQRHTRVWTSQVNRHLTYLRSQNVHLGRKGEKRTSWDLRVMARNAKKQLDKSQDSSGIGSFDSHGSRARRKK